MTTVRPAMPFVWGAVGLFVVLVGFSVLFFHGRLESSDEVTMASATVALADRASLEFAQEVYGRRATTYGIGTSLAGVPAYLLQRGLVAVGLLAEGEEMFFALANSVVLGLVGVLMASLLGGPRRWGAVAAVLLASPLLPASLTFYSEPLTALGLMMVVAACWHGGGRGGAPWWMVLAFAGAATAPLARVASAPLVLLVLVWGWAIGARAQVLGAGLAGVLGGVLGALTVNKLARGDWFATGYEGQDFTTPLLTGLYGLVLSPERGVLIFFPAVLLPAICWGDLGGRMRSMAVLGGCVLLFSLVFHGRFWTWHGGWTVGPRFVLPALVVAMVPVAHLVGSWDRLAPGRRWALPACLLWGGILAFVYSRYSAIAWWNQVWGFHREENQWLLLPQLAMWRVWFDGAPLPRHGVMAPGLEMATTLTGLVLVLAGAYPVLIGWRGYLGTDPEARDEWRRVLAPNVPASWCFVAAGLVAVFAVLPMLRGPRGWQVVDAPGEGGASPSHLILEGRTGRFQGILDYPLGGFLDLHVKANALYRVSFDGRVVMEHMEPTPQRLDTVRLEPGRGVHVIEVEVMAKDDDPRFHLYWTWAGKEHYLAAAGGEYLMPRLLTTTEQFATRLWRRKYIALAGLLALVLLIRVRIGEKEALEPETP